MVGTAYSFRAYDKIRAITSFSEKGRYHGVYLRFNEDASFKERDFYLEGEKVTSQKYAKRREHDQSVPPLFETSEEYIKHFETEFREVVGEYMEIESVKIPLVFNEDGEILTRADEPWTLPWMK